MKLVRFYWSCGRNGSLQGLNIYTTEEWKVIQRAIKDDIDIWFSGYLGKHSEVEVDCGSPGAFEVLSEDQDLLGKLYDLLGTNISGINPLSNIREVID